MKKLLFEATSWLVIVVMAFATISYVFQSRARADTFGGQMKLYMHKENSDANATYNAMSLTPPSPAADTLASSLAIVFIDSISALNTGTTPSVTLDWTPAQNNLLVVFIASSSNTTPTISGSGWTSGTTGCGAGTGASQRSPIFGVVVLIP